MIIELIILAVFVASLAGVLYILFRKLPALMTLPQNGSTGIKKHDVILNIENRIKSFFLAVEKQVYLHKILSWTKCLTLKIETKVDHLLHNIRKKAQEVDKNLKEKK